MAPRGGRGGGGSRGGGSSSPTCPGAFSTTSSQVYFANTVLFFVIFLGICYSVTSVRKKSGAGKTLLGAPFLWALLFTVLGFGLSLLTTILQQCDTIDLSTYYSMSIAIVVFFALAGWLLLFVLVYVLNTMLRAQLGNVKAVFKMVYMVILGFMFALTCAIIGLASYNLWTGTNSGMEAGSEPLDNSYRGLNIAYNVFYLLSVLASGALSLMTLMTLRSHQHPTTDLFGWVCALIFAMVMWTIISIVFAAEYLLDPGLTFTSAAALTYISNFFQALVFIFLLFIAKHAGWNGTSTAAPAQSVYSPPAQHQQPVYEQQPVYNQTPVPHQHQHQHQHQQPPMQQQYAYNQPTTQPYYTQPTPVYHEAPGDVK